MYTKHFIYVYTKEIYMDRNMILTYAVTALLKTLKKTLKICVYLDSFFML